MLDAISDNRDDPSKMDASPFSWRRGGCKVSQVLYLGVTVMDTAGPKRANQREIIRAIERK